ncbi:Ig-like domain-containing protein [Halobacterium sp. NMX12-1]|uniref:Ig-like domain-containing protein n=1 Tax=Halobacterium sp. NMX12-1 TaxID=3166650 RepID=A0AAU8CC64_9EURY
MNWRGDDRAQSVQVGAILLFATLVIALSIYQATVVPSQNADVEYQHSQTTQNQLTDVRNGILRSAATGTTQPASVTLGTQYPSRVFLMNPPPATGTLSTSDAGELRLTNVAASNPETDDFFESRSDAWRSQTKTLSYEPDYNEYDNAPTLLYESSILSNYYPNSDGEPAVPLSDQLLVNEDSKTLTLVALNGSLSTTRASSVSVEPAALSAPYQSIPVEPDSGTTMTLTVPTRVSPGTLASRTSLSAANVSPGPTPNTVNVTLTGEYTLRTAKVGVGTGTTEPAEEYLTLVGSGPGNESVTVEVRDRFNNPVNGVTVNVTAATNPFERASRVTGDDGRATFEAADGASGPATLEILGGAAHENVTVEVEAAAGPVGPGGSGGRLVYLGDGTAFDGEDIDAIPGGLNFTIRNTYASSVSITDVTVEPEDIDLNGLSDKATGEGYGRSELHVDVPATGDSAVVDVPLTDPQYTYVSSRGLTLSLANSTEERVYDTTTDAFETAVVPSPGGPVELGGGGEAEVAFAEFHEVAAGGANAVNVSGQDFRVTVSYTQNGESRSDQFVVYAQSPEANGGGGGGGGGATEPTLESSSVTDRSDTGGSNNDRQARFDVSYSVSDPDDRFDRVEVEFSSPQDTETLTSTSLADTLTYVGPPGSASNQAGDYTISVDVYDVDGNVVDSTVYTETPDGQQG